METIEYCHRRARDCKRLVRINQDRVLITILQSMAHGWTAIANQTERYLLRQKELKARRSTSSGIIGADARPNWNDRKT
jgi:hypothetical protein